ncbi:DNA mismatch repair endonuclease MutL [Leptolyngbya sp. NK1-12]|uniref:DNA mismatch repair protein MutL n=1 Tax=Leptolyngbya sp. NK1-12 TaxID=2547451 RepID=A0AA96W8W6_9CYAN|nr:DNA mismatch repair endonuclease MutL [Leptolyngbya sp. NK1-12]WNZ21877.1 DNA mismatch repair endonuclease MutL [Leptolyngbya sp. NK1-12]
MTTQIQALPVEVIHLIAAGEVIDSLAAVVRELAENALDANATRISISVWTDCWRVRVTDNGIGMTLTDLEQAALPHSTSKIQTTADLGQVHSLGFRGEALHSIAQLADLEICSRFNHSESGYRVTYNRQGEPVQVQTVALATGTIVTASHLFAQWPSRRQSLPSPTQQLRSVQQVVQQLALCHPQVTWQVEQNDRPWLAIWGGASAKSILTQLLKEAQPSDFQELSPSPTFPTSLSAASLYLLLGLPDRCHRHRPDWIHIAVNGRIVQLPELTQVVLSTLRRALPRERFPVCFLHLQVPPAQVDWNRHPAKTEIYLRYLDQWQTQIQQAIDQALQSSLSQLPEAAHAARLSQVLKVAEADGIYRTSRVIQPESPASDDAAARSPQTLLPLKAIAQVHNRYILAEHPTGMWLIEQHIAHERVLYEQLCNRWQIVPLASPLVLGPLSTAQLEQLQRLGIEVEPFGEQRWAVRSAPEMLAERADCGEALWELSQGGNLESALVATACRTAIRNGTPLSLLEMQTLLEQWQCTRNPRTCPHGRPIYLSLEESSLARFFRRHWVIGKSHGIED